MTERDRESIFVEKVREALDAGVENLDERIVSQLRRSRHLALEQGQRRRFSRWRPLRLALAAAAVVLTASAIIFLSSRPGPQLYSDSVAIEDIEILATNETPEFFAELDFFAWLAEEMGDAG